MKVAIILRGVDKAATMGWGALEKEENLGKLVQIEHEMFGYGRKNHKEEIEVCKIPAEAVFEIILPLQQRLEEIDYLKEDFLGAINKFENIDKDLENALFQLRSKRDAYLKKEHEKELSTIKDNHKGEIKKLRARIKKLETDNASLVLIAKRVENKKIPPSEIAVMAGASISIEDILKLREKEII